MLILTLSLALASPAPAPVLLPALAAPAPPVALERTAPALQDAKQDDGPTKEQIEAAVKSVEDAYRSKDGPTMVEAVKRAAQVDDDKVVKAMDKILWHSKDRAAIVAVIDAWGGMTCKASLTHLHDVVKRARKELPDFPDVYADLLNAIANHEDPSSIEFLVYKLTQAPDNRVIKARLYGLARIRDTKAVDELIKLLRSFGRVKLQPFMADFRVALAVLTGTDQGESQELWVKWYTDNHRGLKISQTISPTLDKQILKTWNDYWGFEPEKDEKPEDGDR